MDELTIGDKVFISSKRAAKITGYAKDYIGQLCREGRVEARLVGRNWYVLEESVREHRFGPDITEDTNHSPSNEPVVAWTQPHYSPEVPSPVAPILHKDQTSESARAVVSEMQSAWQEWFATQPERTRQEIVEASSQITEEDAPSVESTEEEQVHISRIEEEVAAQAEEKPVSVVRYERSNIVEEEPVRAEKHQEPAISAATNFAGGMHTLVNSTLIALIVCLVGVTVLGTGVIGDLLLQNYKLSGRVEAVVKYLGGESEYINR